MARVGALKWLLNSHYWKLQEVDQRFWTNLYLRSRWYARKDETAAATTSSSSSSPPLSSPLSSRCGPTIRLDHSAKLFQSMSHHGIEAVRLQFGDKTSEGDDALFYNRLTNSHPCFLHFNGPSKGWLLLFYGHMFPRDVVVLLLFMLGLMMALFYAALEMIMQ